MSKDTLILCWDPKYCRHCFGCVAICPRNALSVLEGSLQYDIGRCIRCSRCASACGAGALRFLREQDLANAQERPY